MEPMVLEVDEHGGGCCGMRHIHDFWDEDAFYEYQTDEAEWDYVKSAYDPPPRKPTMADKIASIQQAIRNCKDSQAVSYLLRQNGQTEKQVLIEAVLARSCTGDEDQFKFWERALQRCGFKRKTEFVNSNTGSTCRVYHFATNQPNRGE